MLFGLVFFFRILFKWLRGTWLINLLSKFVTSVFPSCIIILYFSFHFISHIFSIMLFSSRNQSQSIIFYCFSLLFVLSKTHLQCWKVYSSIEMDQVSSSSSSSSSSSTGYLCMPWDIHSFRPFTVRCIVI